MTMDDRELYGHLTEIKVYLKRILQHLEEEEPQEQNEEQEEIPKELTEYDEEDERQSANEEIEEERPNKIIRIKQRER